MLHNKKTNQSPAIKKSSVEPTGKTALHPRNRHQGHYDFKQLIQATPELAPFVVLNKYQIQSIDFFNADAVRMLNKALLKNYYAINHWNIPEGYLTPPIPGRADYIHHVSDLTCGRDPELTLNRLSQKYRIQCLEIGVGSSCIFPIIGIKEYGWSFIGSEVDPVSIASANKIIEMNPSLRGKIEIRLQENPNEIFKGIIKKDEKFELSICNPPFNSSLADAEAGTLRKLKNLKGKKVTQASRNFGGNKQELWYEGGEQRFVRKMIRQSKEYASSCFWFTTLVSKESNLLRFYKELKILEAVAVITIPMSQGNKKSRILTWTFLKRKEQDDWWTSKKMIE